ncbi:MAG: 2-succinyl-5-enolpyruvyl-6-hydroxy-3-cyclohexene-carboxylate synthase [Acidimicrobiaceae bacterium]|nr:2-succinyl-5-enolpyruvyl-6-hydroxy-3-cyclohexene-carboxylate synthase [Acidimicrobiaceae bacterium]
MTVQATFAATIVDEWVRCGVRHAVLAPGSRSAPLAHALLNEPRLALHVRLDERSAAYFALGIAISTGEPVVVVTTSGTAAAELHAAVLEADLAGVPLICATADRPPELHQVGAAQTVEQEGLFGRAVRFMASPGVPDEAGRPTWRSFGARSVAEARSGPRGPGPVHLNLAFREPLVAEPGPLPDGRPGGAPWHETAGGPGVADSALERLSAELSGARRGVVVAGADAGGAGMAGPRAVRALAAALDWPVLVDTRAWPREPGADDEVLIAAFDQLLRSPRARAELQPDLVLHLGARPASKVLSTWLAALPASCRQVLVDPWGRWQDPDRRVDLVLGADPGQLAEAALGAAAKGRGGFEWSQRWREAERAAHGAIDAELDGEDALSEPGLARALYASVPPGSAIFASSSMPVRELEWFARPRPGAPVVLANRGANGIDGVGSTFLGVAAGRTAAGVGPTYGLVGDLAFLYDLSALVWGRSEEIPPGRLVVVDNGGGAIFSFLPYAAALERAQFERAFGTPQRVDPAVVAAALGFPVKEVSRRDELVRAVTAEPTELEVIVARGERDQNLEVHRRIEQAVAAAVDSALG